MKVRLEAGFWSLRPIWRRPARRLRLELSILRSRLLSRLGRRPARVASASAATDDRRPPIRLAFVGDPGVLKGQTEPTWASEAEATHFLILSGGELPEVTAEALTLAAAAEDLPIHLVESFSREAGIEARLLRSPRRDGSASEEAVLGRALTMIGARTKPREPEGDPSAGGRRPRAEILTRSGPYLLAPGTFAGPVLRQPCSRVDLALAHLPPLHGPPTVVFLLPYLAVGGAERLLFDLLAGLTADFRCLVVTLDPHPPELGQTVDRCRGLTPFVYTLGDWLPRAAAWSALRHLIRRWRVQTLVSWNGTVDFFDHAPELRRDLPHLRLLSQLYHDRGGWTSRTTPSVIRAVDRHLAVNRDIVQGLEARGVPGERIALIHHGVDVPEPPGEEELRQRRAERRRQLGLPAEATVVGTFIRLHEQKRPLDVVALAHRLADHGFFFLLVGGGPLDGELDAELRHRPAPNLVRRPMTREPLPLYDAVDICLMTSSYEGLPVFLLDGLARGLPAVAPAVGDIPLLFSTGGGLLASGPGDLDGLEAGLLELADPDERRRRGEIGRRTVRERFGLVPYRQAYRRELSRAPEAGVVGEAASDHSNRGETGP